MKLSVEYEAEQKEADTYEQNKNNFDCFAAIIRKYVGITELTPTIVNEFIKKIVIHAPKNKNGKRFQEVDVVFNFVGEIHLPTELQTDDTENNAQEINIHASNAWYFRCGKALCSSQTRKRVSTATNCGKLIPCGP